MLFAHSNIAVILSTEKKLLNGLIPITKWQEFNAVVFISFGYNLLIFSCDIVTVYNK
ncbi:hypothetical protein MIDIC_340005 [Alphaproteobacteria bacterium]